MSALRHSTRRRHRSRGQSLVEFVLIAPILLIILATAIDAGRLYFGYVSLVNASKEGALFGGRSPDCDVTKTGCGDPNNVAWHVTSEAGSGVTQTVSCIAPDGSTRGSLGLCVEGDTYRVALTRPFDLITPATRVILGPSLTLGATSNAPVFNPGSLPAPSPSPSPGPSTPPASPSPLPSPAPTCVAPIISFAGSPPLTGTGPLSVTFTGTSSAVPDTLLWTFGDGGQDSTSWPSVSHNYAAVTSNTQYDVTLTVRTGSSDTCASTVSARNYVFVKKP